MFRPDGERIYTEPVPAGTTRGDDDLFGSAVVYVRTEASGASTIWADNVEKTAPTALSTVPAGCDGGRPRVSIWGELVAWTNSCGDRLYVRDVQTGVTREVSSGVSDTAQISLSEGTLTWRNDEGVTRVLDLTSANLAPVALPGASKLVAVDDHLIARQTGIPNFQTWSAEMSPLPFTAKYRPRLISALGPLGFSPNGDSRGDVWTPQFDITKPMRSVTLKIQQGTKTVAQLDGTAPDGSVRDLTWDGLSAKGIQLPEGVYQWTLTGRSADGDGTLISEKGATSPSFCRCDPDGT